MNGIQSLMGGGQGQMPGQAPQQPMPGMMPQQGAPTPGAMVSQLTAMPFEQLQQFYSNPRPQSPPLWAVISAIAEKQKQARAMQMAQGQQAMAQNQQMQQQPPVAAEVVMSAEQTPGMEEQDTVMAALGGMMHSYAGGGAVAFTNGAGPQGVPQENPEEDISDDPSLSFAERRIRAAKRAELARQQGIGRSFAERYPGVTTAAPEISQTDTGDEALRLLKRSPPPTPMISPEAAVLMQRQGPRGVASVSPPRPSGGGAVTKPQEPPKPGLPSLMGPQIDPSLLMAREGQQNIARALERSAQPTPEEIAARGGIDKLLGASASSFEEERKRREALAQQRMQEAQARFERPGYMDMAGIGRLLGGMKGAKTFYQGAVGAGEAAGKYQEDKEAALRAAQEKFDLSGKEMFDLRRLQSQVEMDQAKLVEARASGDAQRSVNAALKLGESQQKLAEFEAGVADKAAGRRLEEKKIDVTQQESIADRASRERIAGAQLAQRAQEIGDLKLVNSLNAANQTVSSAFEKMGRDLEKEFGTIMKMSQMMSPDDIAKDPRLAASYKQYIQKREEYFNKIVQPALDNRDRLANKVLSGSAGNVQKYDAQGNPVK